MTDADAKPIEAVLIAGPTASGKSALALALAERFSGVVINADALQVYADLDVLTARPSADDLGRAPHALYGHVDGAQPHAVGSWLADVSRVLNELKESIKDSSENQALLPIIVGGTGLYFEALTNGLSAVPDIAPEIRARWRSAGPEVDLHAELSARDPVMAARLRPSDPQRLMRALEVIDGTGRSLSAWQAETSPGLLDPKRALRIALAPDRAALDARIARRLEAMLGAGAIEEAERLGARGLDPALPVMKALGVAPLIALARGEIDRPAAFERVRLDTRRYAKRQSTWFRNRMPDWRHVAPETALETAMDEIGRRGASG